MAQATNTTEGEIVLSGDLAGGVDGTFPELRASGVTPGVYAPLARVTFDSKGRAVNAAGLDIKDLQSLIATATTNTNGIFSIGQGLSVTPVGELSLVSATSTIKGGITSGFGTTFTGDAVLTFSPSVLNASAGTSGLVKPGLNFSISGGTLSIANSSYVANGVFALSDINFNVTGGEASLVTVALPIASKTNFGFVKTGTNIVNTSGTISVKTGDAVSLGVIRTDNVTIKNTGGLISINNASDIANGSFSVDGSYIQSSGSGVVTLAKYSKKDGQNLYQMAQCGTQTSVSNISAFSPNFSVGTATTHISVDQNLNIDAPTVLSPIGTVTQQNIILKYSSGSPYTVTLSASYKTNKALVFSTPANGIYDVLTLISTDTMCFAMLNQSFS